MWWFNILKKAIYCDVRANVSIKVGRRGELISKEDRATISNRYHRITKAINQEFWNSTSDTLHSFYVGSYGRGRSLHLH